MKPYIAAILCTLAFLSQEVQAEQIIYEIHPKTGKRTRAFVIPDSDTTTRMPPSYYLEETTLSITIEDAPYPGDEAMCKYNKDRGFLNCLGTGLIDCRKHIAEAKSRDAIPYEGDMEQCTRTSLRNVVGPIKSKILNIRYGLRNRLERDRSIKSGNKITWQTGSGTKEYERTDKQVQRDKLSVYKEIQALNDKIYALEIENERLNSPPGTVIEKHEDERL